LRLLEGAQMVAGVDSREEFIAVPTAVVQPLLSLLLCW
jgi:hypothetical protein